MEETTSEVAFFRIDALVFIAMVNGSLEWFLMPFNHLVFSSNICLIFSAFLFLFLRENTLRCIFSSLIDASVILSSLPEF